MMITPKGDRARILIDSSLNITSAESILITLPLCMQSLRLIIPWEMDFSNVYSGFHGLFGLKKAFTKVGLTCVVNDMCGGV